MKESLTINELVTKNVKRHNDYGVCDDWTPSDWACALAGEIGEACNFIKKLRRGDPIPIDEVGKELADSICYIVLLANKLGLDLETSIIDKFNEVSGRIGSDIFMVDRRQK